MNRIYTMKKIMVLALAATMLYSPIAMADECTFKSKMQGQVKCDQGMPIDDNDNEVPPLYIPAPEPVQGEYGLPFVIPTPCQPFYYQEFVPGYGWQTLRNYRC
jgi:hypothetical protein